MSRVNPWIFAAGGMLLALLAALFLSRGSGDPGQDGLTGKDVAGSSRPGASNRCGSQRTYEEIKRELFRQAADTRGRDQSEFDRIAAYASVRVERPLLRDRDQDLGTMRCAGHLSIDLPPGVVVVGGRRTLSADIDYVLQPAADGSGDVVMLEGADSIIVPLATLASSGETRSMPEPAQGNVPPTAGEPAATPVQSQSAPTAAQPDVKAPPAQPSARPSFNCRYARTRSEIAVCNDGGLASLDRQMAAQYYRAISGADAAQRAQLVRSRDDFLQFRDRCSSNACIAETYRGRMREIRDIMAGSWQPRR